MKTLDIADQSPTAAEFALSLSAWEGQFVEFKEAVADSLARELVALANAAGGRIYIGVADDRQVRGITIDNRLLSRVQDIARNCEPPVAMNLVPFRYEGHGLLLLEVPEGTLKPYSCAAGYFLRTGPNSQKLNRNELVEFVLGLDLLRFEGRECRDFTYPRDFNQREFEAFLRMSGIAAGRLTTAELLVNLALARQDGSQLILTNAAVLFFGKEASRFLPQARVSCVLFRTPERLHILDRKDLNEGLLENLEQAEVFLLKHLPVRYEIKGFSRIEHREFPLEAIREGLVNALMHRDYNVYGGNVFVELYPDRLAIVNPGGLPPGLAEADFGIKSVHRNPLIADLFSRAGKVERAGTGIRRIRDLLAQAGCAEPQFRFTAFFDLILPRLSYPAGTGQVGGEVTGQVTGDVGPHARAILTYCQTPQPLKEIMTRIGIRKRDNIVPHVKLLLQAGLLALTIPDKPRSRLQKYVTTAEGKQWLKEGRS